MRLIPLAAALLFVTSPAWAAPVAGPAGAPPPLPSPPRVFALAGYTEPVIPPASCKAVDATQTRCLIPAMTAGRYLADVSATSTATGADPAQEIVVIAGDQSCRVSFAPNEKTPWAAGTRHTFHIGCVFAIVTDTPLVIAAAYVDRSAAKDPAGPTLALLPQPWGGALNAVPVSFGPAAAPVAPPAGR